MQGTHHLLRILLGLLLCSLIACDPGWQISVGGVVPVAVDSDCAKAAIGRIEEVDSVLIEPVPQAAGSGVYFVPVTRRQDLGRLAQRRGPDTTFRLSAQWDGIGAKPSDSMATAKERALKTLIDTVGVYCAPNLSGVRTVRSWH